MKHEPDTRKISRCVNCELGQSHCICAEIPRLELPLRFLVLRHRREIRVQSNTGFIIPKFFPGSLLLDHGMSTGPFDRSALHEENRRSYLLYPDPQARALNPDMLQEMLQPIEHHETSLPPQLILLDGSWHQVKRMIRKIPPLYSLPRVQLVASPPYHLSSLRLRKIQDPKGRNSLEAAFESLMSLGLGDRLGPTEELAKKWIRVKLHERGFIRQSEL